MTEPPSDREVSVARRVLVSVGLLVYVATGFLYVTSGLVVPGPWLALLLVIWLVGLWFAAKYVAHWSWWVLAAGPLALVFWWAFLSLGEWLFGWTA